MNRILLSGASGFLGKYIHRYLLEEGFKVTTLGRGNINDYQADLSKEPPAFREEFDAVIHAAGLAHFSPRTKEERGRFDLVNVQGTVNLCRALEMGSFSGSFVFISSVAVYGANSGEQIRSEERRVSKECK